MQKAVYTDDRDLSHGHPRSHALLIPAIAINHDRGVTESAELYLVQGGENNDPVSEDAGCWMKGALGPPGPFPVSRI